jgi:hypothetical protein
MAGGQLHKQMTSRMRKAVRLALNSLGREGVADIRELINVPVTYHLGRYGARIAERSLPGEPPRREFRDLYKSIKYKTEAKAETVEDLSIYTARKQAGWLEFGTSRMRPRPFFHKGAKKRGNLQRRFKKRLAEVLKEMDSKGV